MATDTKRIPDITILNAKLIYLNFAGAAKTFNAKGNRNFHVVLDSETAKRLKKDGWNVRTHEPKEDGDEPWFSLKVRARFDNFPPRIILITTKGQSLLNENTVELLDDVDIKMADVMITPYNWKTKDGSGITAYLKKMFVTLSDDDLEAKYFSKGLTSAKSGLEEDDD